MIQRLFPHDTPKIIRILCYVTMGFFSFFGLAISAVQAAYSLTSFVVGFLFFVLCGGLCCVMTIALHKFLVSMMRKNTIHRLENGFTATGYTTDLAETVERAIIVPESTDKLVALFLQVKAELYNEANQYALKIDTSDLSMRQTASFMTSRMLGYMMTGQPEKAHILFEKNKQKNDLAYENHPDLGKEFHEYADDALTWFMLAPVICIQRGETAEAAQYLPKIKFQLSKYDATDSAIYERLHELNMLYARQETQKAYPLEQQLKGELETGALKLPLGKQRNFLRLAEQARIYAAFNHEGSAKMLERKLPD